MMTAAPARSPAEAISGRAAPELASAIIGAIAAYEPSRVHVAHVRDWFGPNWLGFKGKVLGALGIASGPGGPLVIPPFVPNRIEGAFWFDRVSGRWAPAERPPLNVATGGEANTRRYFERIAGLNAMAVWIGDDGHGRQAVMVYASVDGGPIAWYASTEAAGRAAYSKLAWISEAEFTMLQGKAGA